MTTVVAISDYKGILEMMSNGIPAPYFGIRGPGSEPGHGGIAAECASGIYGDNRQ